MSEPVPLPVQQLIYTNVESEQSPTRQRGFQVWQWSKNLSVELRRLVAKRLEDFKLPQGASATDTGVLRHVFFRLAEGCIVIARTVPLKEKDKFGRGGKFFAHAVVISDEDFAAIGWNPFQIIDGGFRFAEHPDDIIAANPDWLKGELPNATFESFAPLAEKTPIDKQAALDFYKHLESDDDRPIVLATNPAEVLGVLRRLFSLFPPEARQRLSFDTMATGASLQQTKYAVAGAFSPEALKLWMFRRYIKLELAKWQFTPKLETISPSLPLSLMFSNGWESLSDRERAALFEEGQKLADVTIDGLKPDGLTPEAIAVLDECEETRSAITALAAKRLAADLPEPLVLPAVAKGVAEWFMGPVADVLPRLAHPIPAKVIDDGLRIELGQDGAARPPSEAIRALGPRIGSTHSVRLPWIVRRWRGSTEDLEELVSLLSTETPDPRLGIWIRKWVLSTLPKELQGDDRLQVLVRRLSSKPAPTPEYLADAKLLVAIDHQEDNLDWWKAALFTAACTGEPSNLPKQTSETFREELHTWVMKVIVKLIGDQYSIGCGRFDDGLRDELLIGLFFTIDTKLEYLLSFLEGPNGSYDYIQRLIAQLCPPDPFITSTPADRIEDRELEPKKKTKKLYEDLRRAKSAELKTATEELKDYLVNANNDEFRWVANLLIEKSSAHWKRTNHENLIFVGLKVFPQIISGNLIDLFEAVSEAVADNATKESFRLGGTLLPKVRTRFFWLMSRLKYDLHTKRLKI